MSERKYGVHTKTGEIISLERQAAKRFRRAHGHANGAPMSGRQFRKARKAGQRIARAEAKAKAQQASEPKAAA